MAIDTTNDLRDFRDFISNQLNRHSNVPSPEDCLRLWREHQEIHSAIRQGINEADQGLGQPAEEFLSEFHRRNGISPQTDER